MKTIARDGLSSAEVIDLISSASAIVDARVELLNTSLEVVRTVESQPFGWVSYTADQTVPLKCTLVLAESIDWATAWLRPVATVTDGSRTIEVQLGAFVPSLPTVQAGDDPKLWEVSAYGLTAILNHPHGRSVRLAQGGSYLTLARDLCEAKGLTVSFAAEADAKLASRDRIWPLDKSITTLQIVNEALEECGYTKVQMAAAGVLRSEPARDPAERGTTWEYDTTSSTTIVGPIRQLDSNRLDVPNRLVAISSAATAWDPVTGDGVHVIEDATAIAEQGERSDVVTLDAVDQEELVAAAERKWAELSRVDETIIFTTLPNPLHSHDSVVRINDPDLDVLARRFLVTGWTYNLDGTPTSVTGVRV